MFTNLLCYTLVIVTFSQSTFCAINEIQTRKLIQNSVDNRISNHINYFDPCRNKELCLPFWIGRSGTRVNFFGFRASAGLLGGLLGEGAWGGPHAEATTPFGESAGAGVGFGEINGSSVAYAYAGAELGQDVVGVCIVLGEANPFKFYEWGQCMEAFNIS